MCVRCRHEGMHSIFNYNSNLLSHWTMHRHLVKYSIYLGECLWIYSKQNEPALKRYQLHCNSPLEEILRRVLGFSLTHYVHPWPKFLSLQCRAKQLEMSFGHVDDPQQLAVKIKIGSMTTLCLSAYIVIDIWTDAFLCLVLRASCLSTAHQLVQKSSSVVETYRKSHGAILRLC